MYYNRKGELIDTHQWCMLRMDRDYSKLALTELPNGSDVSTVWLGLDHNYLGCLNYDYMGIKKLIFETIVFGKEGSTDLLVRYETEDEAFEGHAKIVADEIAKATTTS